MFFPLLIHLESFLANKAVRKFIALIYLLKNYCQSSEAVFYFIGECKLIRLSEIHLGILKMKLSILKSKPFKAVLLCGVLLNVVACDLANNTLKTDRAANMEFQDYRDGMAPRMPAVDDQSDAQKNSIPDFQSYVANTATTAKPMPLVSLSVNQTVPLRDVLYELAQQAEYDLELDPNIRGSIIFTARERPFDQVIERISEIAGLRFKFEGDVMRVEVDTPYNKTYKIDYLNYVRSNTGSVRNDIAVVSGDGADTGSTFRASIESEADFWGELEANVQQILGNAANRSLRTSRDPRITAAPANPDVSAVAPRTDDAGNITVSAPEAVLRVDSLPIDEQESGSRSRRGSSQGSSNDMPDFSFAVNKQAGLITVFANERAQKELEQYLNKVRRSVTSQVLIEAKILEVSLTDQFSAGINWDMLRFSSEGIVAFVSTPNRPVIGLSSDSSSVNANFVAGYVGNDIAALMDAIQGFGTVRALASPRMTVLNNQSAVMNVATNRVFFELDVNRTVTTDGAVDTSVNSTIRNVPEGVLMNVIPSIDLESGTVSLSLRPTITKITAEKQDPGVAFIAEDIVSLIPELNVQEIDSVIKVNSGQAIVLGGLLQDRIESTTQSVPVVGELPVVGNLFRKRGDNIQKTELVILLKATIVEGGNTVHNTDKDLYRTFSQDRRPFKL
jgi:general secretion pathway protein D